MHNECAFCLEKNNLNPLIKTMGLESSIIFETNNWFVTPSIGGFLIGYLLIINKNHMPSIALCDAESYDELESIILKLRKAAKKILNMNAILFEHGGINFSEKGAKSVEHVHLHFVPTSANLLPFLKTPTCTFYSFNDLKRIAISHNSSYLFYENTLGERYFTIYDDKYYCSQFFRKCIAQSSQNDTCWDWRQTEFKNLFVETYMKFKGLL